VVRPRLPAHSPAKWSGASACSLVTRIRVPVGATTFVLPILQELPQLRNDLGGLNPEGIIRDANACADPSGAPSVVCAELGGYSPYQEPKAFNLCVAGRPDWRAMSLLPRFVARRNAPTFADGIIIHQM
jgi:hypothetical protein